MIRRAASLALDVVILVPVGILRLIAIPIQKHYLR